MKRKTHPLTPLMVECIRSTSTLTGEGNWRGIKQINGLISRGLVKKSPKPRWDAEHRIYTFYLSARGRNFAKVLSSTGKSFLSILLTGE